MAGAAGDALGYAVEFMSRKSILAQYGDRGITKFDLSPEGKALVSDDTQMTLFTANGMLMGVTRGYMRVIDGAPENYVDGAYLDWYYTQTGKKRRMIDDWHYTWLRDLPELAHRRAPGNTCMEACEAMLNGTGVKNCSKGCGGIMRVAPMALLSAGYMARGERFYSIDEMDTAGAETARVTHKHPLGFLPAAMLTHLLYKLVSMSVEAVREEFEQLIEETVKALDSIYKDEFAKDKRYLAGSTSKAIHLAQSDTDDNEAIDELGEGWTGEEAWAISLYCAIRHIDSIHDAIVASVNHKGDSDSTGAVCGNLLGAWLGEEAVRQAFCLEQLELRDLVEAQALALFALAEPDPPRAGLIYTPLTKAALRLCFQAHSGQTDKGGLPYVIHPLHLAEQMETEEEICAALLHDTIEDAFVTPEALHAAGFPEGVVEAVRLLTRPQGMPYLTYIAALRANPIARRVKTADLRHNLDFARLGTVTAADRQRAETYRNALRLLLADSI